MSRSRLAMSLLLAGVDSRSGEWTRFVRRMSGQPKELVLEITEQRPDGRRFERRLVLARQ